VSFKLEGTVGLKNGLRIIYAFESRTSGKTRRVPWVGTVSLNLVTLGQQNPRTNVEGLNKSHLIEIHPWNVLKMLD
jgi:hypothetical protein